MNWLGLVLAPFLFIFSFLMPKQRTNTPTAGSVDAQTSDEGTAPPVIYGTRDTTMNVVWNGKSYSRVRRKKKQTVGYYYDKDLAGVLCSAPIDAITRIECSDREIYRGEISTTRKVYINAVNIFGGADREGGVLGNIDFLMGDDEQTPNAYMVSKVGNTFGAMRGVISLVFNRLYVGMNPYFRDFKFRIERLNTGWYPEKNKIQLVGDVLLPILNQVWSTKQLPTQANPGYTNLSRPTVFDGLIARQSPFGSGEPPLNYPAPKGLWQNNTVYWVIKKVTIPTGRIAKLHVFAENGCVVLLNNKIIGSINRDNLQPEPETKGVFNIPAGTHEIAIKAFDEVGGAGITYLSAEIIAEGESDINPAHIIRDALTNTRYGLAIPEENIDDAAFRAMADTLYAEKTGMSIIWQGSTKIEDFIDEVCRHIKSTRPFIDEATGLWTCKLLRDDYVASTLIHLDESNISSCKDFKRPSMSDLVNTVTVTYWDREQGKNSTVTVDNPARIIQQGRPITEQVDYNGFTHSDIAARAAMRDLKVLSNALATVTIVANSQASLLKIGDCFRFSWADYGLNQTVMRVTSIKESGVLTNDFTIECIEDAYTMPMKAVVPYIPPNDTDFNNALPCDGMIIEAPYYEMVQRYSQTFIDSQLGENGHIGYVLAVANTEQTALNASMLVSSGADFDDVAIVDFSQACHLISDVGFTDTTISVSDYLAFSEMTADSYFKINDELMGFVSISANVVTVKRGVLDTVPQKHLTFSKIWLVDTMSSIDEQQYFDGQIVAVKLLTNTGADTLAEDEAETLAIEIQGRAFRPYPPANVKINNEYYPDEVSTAMTLTWVDRNRLQQTAGILLGYFDGGVVAETNVEYVVELYDSLDTLISSQNVGAVNTYVLDYSAVTTIECRVKIYSIRDGYQSYQAFEHTMTIDFEPPFNIQGTWNDATQVLALTWDFNE